MGATAACRRDAARGSATPDSTAAGRPVPAVAFRLPTQGGQLAVYTLPALDATPWGTGGRTAGARSAIGVDLQGRRLLYRDSGGAIAALDLVAMRERPVAPRGSVASLGADGTLMAVDRRGTVLESQPWGTRPWPSGLGTSVRDLFASPGGRLIAVRDLDADTLAIATREGGISRATAVPEAADRAASFAGDAVAFATDSGLVVYEDREADRPWFVRLTAPHTVAFSPSGHRLYAALRAGGELAVVDRYTREARASISLPGVAAALRMDPWGRVILVRAADEDATVWVVGIADGDVNDRLHTRWGTDLPTVSETGVLLSREGEAVVARDVRTLDSLGAVAGGAADLWFTGRWVPRSQSAVARAENAPRDTARRQAAPPPGREGLSQALPAPQPRPADRAPSPVTRQPLPGVASYWVQVTSTRFVEGARALSDTLRREGHPASVVEPRSGDNIWRVMTGPWPSREVADSAGRALGRPYFVTDRSRL